jgi:hypothetical protein
MTIDVEALVVRLQDPWLSTIYREIIEMHHRKEIHDGMRDMLEAQAHSDVGYFWEAFHRMYIESQTTGIRRQTDDDSRTLSLRRLLGQIQENRKLLTRAWYVGRARRTVSAEEVADDDLVGELSQASLASNDFDQFTDSPGDEYISLKKLDADRRLLLETSKKVTDYVDTVVAHTDEHPTPDPPTYNEFEESIRVLGDMLKRYFLLIKGNSLADVTPTIQGDWQRPFRTALANP